MFEGHDRTVRCSAGHLFTTIWMPLVSVKAVRLGPSRRWQHCPVGAHWAMVAPVDDGDLDAAQLAAARDHHDVRVP